MAAYRQAISAASSARERYPSAVGEVDRGSTIAGLAGLLAAVGRSREAVATYRSALRAFDAAVQLSADRPLGHENKGHVLRQLAELQIDLGHRRDAAASYRSAVAACDAAVGDRARPALVVLDKGETHLRLAELSARDPVRQHAARQHLTRAQQTLATVDRIDDQETVRRDRAIVRVQQLLAGLS